MQGGEAPSMGENDKKKNSSLPKYCYICGYDFSSDPEFLNVSPPYFDCPCCVFEYGIEEFENNVFLRKRDKWMREGLTFSYELARLNMDWTLDSVIRQLGNLKKINFDDYRFKAYNLNYSSDVDLEIVKKYWEEKRGSAQ